MWFSVVILIIGVIGSFYYYFKATNNLSEYGQNKILKILFGLGIFSNEYFTDRGLNYRNKSMWFSFIAILGFFLTIYFLENG